MSPTVTFRAWIHGNEDIRVVVHSDLPAKQGDNLCVGLDRSLDQLHALRDGTHLLFQESVELVETPPRTTPNKTYEDATHRLEVNALVAIENEDLPTEARTESLH